MGVKHPWQSAFNGLEESMVIQGTVNPPPLARLVRSQYNPPKFCPFNYNGSELVL